MVRLITLVSYFYIATGAFQSIQMDDKNASNKFRDVTDPLNALMQGQISSVDFFTKSGFVENGTETKTKLNLYSPDCSTIQECVDEINTVGRFWNETLGRDLLDLTMSITLNNHTLAKLIEDNALNVKLRRPDFQTNYLVNINESVACDDLPDMRNEVWNYLTGFNGRRYGIGINEELIHCIAATERIRYSTEWAVVYFKFRGTVGIPESFGMFRKRMVSLHAESAEVLLRYSIHHSRVLPKLCYYPTVQAEWDEYHYKLFENYMEHWQNEKIDGMELIIRSKLLSFTQTFSVVPYIKYPIDSWYAPSSVQAFSKHFKNIILEYDEWKFWNSDGRKALYNSVKIAPIYNKIEVILKYSFAKKNGTTHVNQKPIQDILEALQIVNEKSSMEPFVLKSILFNIERRENNNYSLQIDTNIGQQITSHGVNVGCVCLFLPELVIKSVAAGVVQACKEINGTLYILYHPRIYMSADPVDPSYYENNVRKILESAKELRTFILKLHPTAQVYFDFPIISSVDVCQRDNVRVTAFCNQKILRVNENYEAIINWAKFNDFPVVLKSAVDSFRSSDCSSWLSLLRPTFWNGNLVYEPKVAELHPLLVLRNYPRGINNWTVDPCIDWTTRRPEIGVDYFLNKHVGTIFDTRYIRKNGTIQSEEYEMLVSYISYRFTLAEIILSDNWQEFTSACKEFRTEFWNDPENNYFINYAFSYKESSPIKNLTQVSVVLEFLNNEIINKGKCTSQGVHIDLSIFDVQAIISDARIVKILKEKTEKLDINIGILINSTTCMEVFRRILFRNLSISYILTPLNYLVCKERYTLPWLDKIDRIGKVLDTHLYLKRVFKEFEPNLDIYFRIEVDVVLDRDERVMERYLRLLSHFKQFGQAYDVSYFVVQAFDEESGRRNGWWTNNAYTNLSNPFTYVEKESVYAGRKMWRPLPLGIPSKIPPSDHNIIPPNDPDKIPPNDPDKILPNDHDKIPPNDQSQMSVTVIVAVVLMVILVVGLLACSAFHYMRYKQMRQFLSNEEVKEFLNGKSQPTEISVIKESQMCTSADYMKFHKDYDLQLADLWTDQQCLLGTGNFGVVYKGTANGIPAAVKQPNKNCTKGSFKSCLSEVKVHCYIGVHTNIVGFLGAYTKEIHKGTLLVATELCPNGSLKGLLRRKTTVISHPNQNDNANTLSHSEEEKAIETHDLCRFSHEIASGMDYLESKQVVHGDLSARNVLLNENYTCKIGDFGLSRKLYEYQKYVKKSQEPLPWKWMAHESLTQMEFTSKSDVWSYGVTLWEIFSLGKIPYGPMNWTLEFPDELQKGLRLRRPEFSSEQIYGRMLECWNLDIELRPKFSELVVFFREIDNVEYTVLGDE